MAVDRCRKRLFETAKNNSRTVPKHATIMVPPALRGARVRNRENPTAGSEPKGYAIRPYKGAEGASSKPLKTIEGPSQSMPPYGPSSAPWGTPCQSMPPYMVPQALHGARMRNRSGKPQQDPGPRAMPCVRRRAPKALLRNR